jgi:predicted membrane-bound spermidine synthase
MGVLLLPLVLRVLLRRPGPMPAAPVVLAAASAGFAGLSCEIAALFIFQNAWGFAYGTVGLLIALFMLGLGAGAAAAMRCLERKRPDPVRSAYSLAALLLLMAVLSLACLPLLGAFFRLGGAGQLLLASWLGGMGLLAGAVLPLGMRVLDRRPAGQSAGLLNAGDYLGGAAGSLFMASLFLPLLGTAGSLRVVFALALASAALLGLAAARARR